MTTPIPEPLPGLDDLDPERTSQTSALHRAIRRTVKELSEAGHVKPSDAARLQLALTMADIIEAKQRSGRLSTVGNDARVLMELLTGLLEDAAAVDDDLREAMEQWAQHTGAQT
jgi:hypothetical protein